MSVCFSPDQWLQSTVLPTYCVIPTLPPAGCTVLPQGGHLGNKGWETTLMNSQLRRDPDTDTELTEWPSS